MLLMRSGLAAQGKNIFAELFFFLRPIHCPAPCIVLHEQLGFFLMEQQAGVLVLSWLAGVGIGHRSMEEGEEGGRAMNHHRHGIANANWRSQFVPPPLPLKFRRRQRPDKKGNLESQREERSLGRPTFFRILLLFFLPA